MKTQPMPTGPSCPCPKCGGTGNLPAFKHIDGGVCFMCRGNRIVPAATARMYEIGHEREAGRAMFAGPEVAR